ncbi:MAG TPA: tetratricopeptide repeat protein [Vitreimonas sp.]|nr:tetratricopeptide repeat protein [Vitreimonas sp.]
MTQRTRLAIAAACLLLAACATAAPPEPREADSYADHLVGRLANLRQDHTAAADRYFAALQREPGNDALLSGAVLASLASGDAERARQAARMAPRADAPAYAHLVRAADDMAAARNGAAADELVRAEGGAAEELIGRMMQVWAQAAGGHVDDVVGDLAPLASIRPYGGLFAYQQAMALDYAGRNEDAIAAYAAAADSGSFLPPAIARHADLLVRVGRRDEALALLEQDTNATNPVLVAARGRLVAGRSIEIQRLTTARGAAVGLYGLAAIFHQEGDATNALAALTLALMLDPQLDAAHLMFAQVQSSLGHPALARTSLARIPSTSSYASSARVMEAWTLVDEGRSDEAIAITRAAGEAGDVRAKRALADMYRNLQRYDEAEPIYTELIESAPNDWRLYFSRGAARERLGRWPEAEADFQRALRISPEQPEVLNYLGYSWIDRGERLQEALVMIQRAVELRPSSGAIIDSLGWAYYRLGDYAQAVDHLEHAVQLEPADATLNDHLGDVYWRLGRRIEARFQWQRALTLEPSNRAEIEAKLDHGLPAEPAPLSATR